MVGKVYETHPRVQAQALKRRSRAAAQKVHGSCGCRLGASSLWKLAWLSRSASVPPNPMPASVKRTTPRVHAIHAR